MKQRRELKNNTSFGCDNFIFLNTIFKNFARIAVAIVLFLNLQCAILFLLFPSSFIASFELVGFPGETAIRGMAVLFLMWSVPYAFAIVDPYRFRISYMQAVIMQFIGLIGETALYFTLPDGHNSIMAGLFRFIVIDGLGGILLLVGFFSIKKSLSPNHE